ncbi:MAG: hypothetical protein ACPLZD_05440 [Candidatus Saccharicenans sp.]|nr:MAG: hypothetical protein C0168_02500 [Candidatus Aminicenantes bacterium]HEK86027.1 hypothetical protein [Candidatus Aminicenantes bacterium]
MPKLNEILNLRERKILNGLCLGVLFVLVVLIISLFFWSSKLSGARREAEKERAELAKITTQVDQTKLEFLRWQATAADVENMRKEAVYSGEQSLDAFRDDLKRIFQQSGLPLPPINYQYEESGNKEFRKLSASFNLRLSYQLLKQFLYQLESWPRLLVLDQINFQKIDNLSGLLELRLTVAGFYHEKS